MSAIFRGFNVLDILKTLFCRVWSYLMDNHLSSESSSYKAETEKFWEDLLNTYAVDACGPFY